MFNKIIFYFVKEIANWAYFVLPFSQNAPYLQIKLQTINISFSYYIYIFVFIYKIIST